MRIGVRNPVYFASQYEHRKTVYLAGPINGCSDAECNDWREKAKTLLTPDMDVLNPMVRDYRGQETESTDEIVEGDKKDIDISDALLVFFDRPSVGTAMEMLYAWERKKKIVVVNASKSDNGSLSPWLAYHSSNNIVGSVAEGVKRLRELLG
jgi:nucleoside 2-deoxyribosyltransferase